MTKAHIVTESGTIYVVHDDRTLTRMSEDPIPGVDRSHFIGRPFTLDAPAQVGERFRYRLTDTNEPINATRIVKMALLDDEFETHPVDRLDWADLGLSDPQVLANLRR